VDAVDFTGQEQPESEQSVAQQTEPSNTVGTSIVEEKENNVETIESGDAVKVSSVPSNGDDVETQSVVGGLCINRVYQNNL